MEHIPGQVEEDECTLGGLNLRDLKDVIMMIRGGGQSDEKSSGLGM